MNVIVVGYGRVGAALARELLEAGHLITVIDKDSQRVQRAVRLQGARVITGNAVDVQVQRDAGVGSADLMLAVTSNDNVNLVAAQIAIEVFQVTNVIARVYTPSRADVSAARGITTICPTRYTVDALWEKVREAASEAMPHSPPLRRQTRPRNLVTLPSSDEAAFVVIAGGGRVGFHLARSLRAAGHEVALIERDPRIAAELQARLDSPVVVGDGSMAPVLEEAGAVRAKVFAAVTGRDEDNLVACQTVKTMAPDSGAGKGPKTIARISDPQNEELYHNLGVDATISATSLIQSVIERELPTMKIKKLLSLQRGAMLIEEITLAATSPVVEHPLRDVVLPKESNVIAIERGAKTVVPRGDTVFKAGDVVLTLVAKDQEGALREVLLGPETTHNPQPPSEHA
jgi:trk system potassium uptake protein TrkA